MIFGPRFNAICPHSSNSRMPKGSSTSNSARSLSWLPVASMTTDSCATSTTRARKSFAASTTCGRLELSADTLTMSSARAIIWSSARRTTFSTGTSLFSCLVICSIFSSSVSTTMVMRLTPGVSVVAEVMDTMVNARRVNMAATREMMPSMSSTRTLRVWREMSVAAISCCPPW